MSASRRGTTQSGSRLSTGTSVNLATAGWGSWVAIVAMACLLLSLTASAAVAQDGIFVPTPRGSGESLDASAQQSGGKSSAPDVVLTTGGDRILGAIGMMKLDDMLTLSGPQFTDAVKVRSAAIAALEFGAGGKDAGGDEVLITNGDRLMGRIVSIGEDNVVLQAASEEPITISRRMISRLTFDGGSSILLKSGFGRGQMAPWAVLRGGNYSISEGRLVSNNSGSNYPIAAQLEQKEAITVIVKFRSLDRNGPYCSISMFVDSTDSQFGRNSVTAMFSGNSHYAYYSNNGSTNQVNSGNFGGRNMMEGEVRAAYDPATKTISMWVDSNKLGEWRVPHNVETGSHLMFTSQYYTSYESITVLKGIVPPSESIGGGGEEKREVVVFRNKDRMAVDDLRLADGEFLLKSTYGELKCPANTVTTISMRTDGAEKPRMRKGDVRVTTPAGQITLQFKGLTDEFLIGESDAFGEVKLLREGIRRIDFNIHEPTPSGDSASAGSPPPPGHFREGPSVHFGGGRIR